MKLTSVVSKRGWLPEHKVKFQALLPLKLKNSVSGKGEKTSENPCTQELMNLMSCLKKNEFGQTQCSKEIDVLNMCYKAHGESQKREQEQMRMGNLTPGAKHLNHRQLGILLKRYPTR